MKKLQPLQRDLNQARISEGHGSTDAARASTEIETEGGPPRGAVGSPAKPAALRMKWRW